MDALVYSPSMAEYRLSPSHPLQPERFTLTVDLIDSWGLTAREDVVVLPPAAATAEDLLLAHDAEYVRFVERASASPAGVDGHGIGPGDTPAFLGMHEASLLAVGGTMRAIDAVLRKEVRRAFSPAGGLHHAHKDHASGFCIYNDCAVAIEAATIDRAGLRVAYVDVDAHHGDGVQAAFYERADVLTISVHESGRYLFPGTGRPEEIGAGTGRGYAINTALPPFAGPASYQSVLDEVIGPALSAYRPDLIVAQLGADTHRADPLTHLFQSVRGFGAVVESLIALAEELAEGRIVATGGGGYRPHSEVPRMWATAFALLIDQRIPRRLPAEWRSRAQEAADRSSIREHVPEETLAEDLPELDQEASVEVAAATRSAIEATRRCSPLLNGSS